jgi:archaellum component FlaC
MELSTGTVAVIGALLTLAGTGLGAYLTYRAAAKKQDLDVLRGIIDELKVMRKNDQEEIVALRAQIAKVDSDWREKVQILELGWKRTEKDYQEEIGKLRERVRILETELERVTAENHRLKGRGKASEG